MRDHFFSLLQRRTTTVDDPIFGTTHVQELDAQERIDALRFANVGTDDEPRYDDRRWFAYIVSRTILETDGARMFSDADLPRLCDMRSDRLATLAQYGTRLSEAAPGAMKSGDPAPDDRQLDTQSGATDADGDADGG